MQKKFPLCARLDALAIAAMAALLTYVLWEIWSTRLDYAFGYLMPMFMAYVVWDRLPKIEKYFASEPSERGGKFAELFFGGLFGSMAVCGFATFLMFSIVYSVFDSLFRRQGRDCCAAFLPFVFVCVRVLRAGVFCGV